MTNSKDDEARPSGGLCLAIDTAGARCSAAVLDMGAKAVLAEAEPEIGRGHAEKLMEVVADVLKAADASYADLSRVAVTLGPGSFTGIRVGVATARGLALALNVPALGVSTLEALAEPFLDGSGSVLAVQDAKRGEVYVALYAPDGALLAGPAAIAPDDLPVFAGEAAAPLRLVGSGAGIAAERLPDAEIADDTGAVAIAAVARIGARRMPGEAVRPLYLRGADAKPQTAPSLRRSGSQPGFALK
ncbi:tRNA (adenosine(37)-N6)-threonylcarbamoyltransferase complex dimerization subunit type 1 TsaB [Aureimonas mangrovi]|uniref:tRNA (adenosine(37)-N6)-threonylcarbamoyltransferase complex dimerization subunit type 1 TsaB n=1 Tax=Aureimonas mangrovi TaxID=2758041 RepID=UPI00163D9605|nr:tRNA (adenosine(37)-N6)-threonylcarbamoyltransferase complex dimerization subunit type 1 TsaB [Aureimonas mangrovi]